MMSPSVSSELLEIANQAFILEKKVEPLDQTYRLNRPVKRILSALEKLGLTIHDPLGEAWSETRTDCEATISGDSTDHLVITEVIKPIIRVKEAGMPVIVQRGLVVVSTATNP